MKLKTSSLLQALSAAAILFGSATAHATLVGLDIPADNHAVWDTFTTFTFNNYGAQQLEGFTSATLAQTLSSGFGAGIRAQGDMLSAGNFAANWLVTVTASEDITSLVFQIKHTTASQHIFAPVLSIEGGTAIAATTASAPVTADAVYDGAFPTSVTTWTWTGLNIEANDSFTINFKNPASTQNTVDAIALHAVPEPGTWALLAGGALFAGWRLRKR